MGWYLRKSVRLGPVRLNFSKSGVGASVGVTGARISTGPRGTYVHAGRGGIYFRQRLDGVNHLSIARPAVPDLSRVDPYDPPGVPAPDLGDFSDTPPEPIIASINRAASIRAMAPLAMIAVSLLVVSLIASGLVAVGVLALVLGSVVVVMARRTDARRRTYPLHFELDEPTQRAYLARAAAVRVLSGAKRIWHQGGTVQVGPRKPPHIDTNVRIVGIDVGSALLLFFPDQLLVFRSGKYTAVRYDDLAVGYDTYNHVGSEHPPSDARIVGYQWLHSRVDGGPDRRFNHNPKYPIVQYGKVSFGSSNGSKIEIHVSSREIAERFVSDLEGALALAQSQAPERHKGVGEGAVRPNGIVAQSTPVTYRALQAPPRPVESLPPSQTVEERQAQSASRRPQPTRPETSGLRLTGDLPPYLAGCGPDIVRLVVERPDAWQYELFLLAWIEEVQRQADVLRAYDARIPTAMPESLPSSSVMDWVSARLDDFSWMLKSINDTLNDQLQDALSLPSDPERLIWVGRQMASILLASVDCTQRIRHARADRQFGRVLLELAVQGDDVIGQIRGVPERWLQQVRKTVERASTGGPQSIDLTLEIQLNDAERLHSAIEELYR